MFYSAPSVSCIGNGICPSLHGSTANSGEPSPATVALCAAPPLTLDCANRGLMLPSFVLGQATITLVLASIELSTGLDTLSVGGTVNFIM